MEIERTPENRESLSKGVARVINDVFRQGTNVSVHWNLSVESEYTGTYVSAFITTSSVVRSERRELKDNGLHLVEQAAHITENSNMDDSIEEIPREELDDAAETDTELVLELDEEFVRRVL